MTFADKIIVTQDDNIYNLNNIIKIFWRRDSNYGAEGLCKVFIKDTSEDLTEIYRGTEEECKYTLGRIQRMIASGDPMIRLDYL